mgnify:CR=1 FL=1
MGTELKNIPLNQIRAKSNYRKTFKDKSLQELAARDPGNTDWQVRLANAHFYAGLVRQREDDLDVLLERIHEEKLNAADYEWYIDLRRYAELVAPAAELLDSRRAVGMLILRRMALVGGAQAAPRLPAGGALRASSQPTKDRASRPLLQRRDLRG